MELRKDHDGRGYASVYEDMKRVSLHQHREELHRGNYSPKPRTARKENTISDNNVDSVRYHFFLYASVEIDMNNFA